MHIRDNNSHKEKLGYVVGGSLKEGLLVKIFSESLSLCTAGTFVVILVKKKKILSLIHNVSLQIKHATSEYLTPLTQVLMQRVHANISSYIAQVTPLWTLEEESLYKCNELAPGLSWITSASDEDILRVWQTCGQKEDIHYTIGTLPASQSFLTVPLKSLIKRSNAIFGKTGTGKTFLARHIFSGIISHKVAALLVFDMHSEYAFSAIQEHSKKQVQGLKSLYPQHVLVASLENKYSASKKSYDIIISIPLHMIHIDDVLALQRELALHTTACEAAYLLYAKFHKKWLETLIERGNDIVTLANEIGAHTESLAALYRKLKRVADLPYIEKTSERNTNSLSTIIHALEQGTSIIVEFGPYNSSLSYLFVANVLTRMLHESHIFKTQKFLESKHQAEPCQVIIVIEEAHKFLHPSLAYQTPFGMIAREMRKYYLSLFIIDQRPSHIDDEIVSQLGTKFLLGLNDQKDCDAALAGIEKAHHVKQILETLSGKQEMVIVGQVAPFPIKIKTIAYQEKAPAPSLTNEITEKALW